MKKRIKNMLFCIVILLAFLKCITNLDLFYNITMNADFNHIVCNIERLILFLLQDLSIMLICFVMALAC